MMKRSMIILISLVSLLPLSCRKMDDHCPCPPAAIEFSPQIQTRAFISREDDPLFREGFSVFAKKTNADNESAEIMTNRKVRYDNASQQWTYRISEQQPSTLEPAVPWGLNCDHHFLAVFPFMAEGEYNYAGETYSIANVKTVKTSGGGKSGKPAGPDLMYGRAQRHYQLGDQPSPVQLTMRHALSAISFNVRNASPYDITSITDVKLEGLITKAASVSYVRNSNALPEIILSDESRIYKLSDHAGSDQTPYIRHGDTEYKAMDETFIVIPQNFNGYTVTLKFKVVFKGIDGNVNKNLVLSNIKLGNNDASLNYSYVTGRHYVYNIDVTNNDITCEASVVPWMEDNVIELK